MYNCAYYTGFEEFSIILINMQTCTKIEISLFYITYIVFLPGSWCLRFLAKCVNCNGIYLVSARGGLFGAGGDDDAPGPNGHKNALCNSQPTSDIILAFRKYGVTSRKNLTETYKKKKNIHKIDLEI